jgi:hypothetical protein
MSRFLLLESQPGQGVLHVGEPGAELIQATAKPADFDTSLRQLRQGFHSSNLSEIEVQLRLPIRRGLHQSGSNPRPDAATRYAEQLGQLRQHEPRGPGSGRPHGFSR